MEEHNLEKLPRWARDLIGQQSQRIKLLSEDLEMALGKQSSRVVIDDSSTLHRRPVFLREDSPIRFKLGDLERSDKMPRWLEVNYQTGPQGEERLVVRGSTNITIDPVVANVIHVQLK